MSPALPRLLPFPRRLQRKPGSFALAELRRIHTDAAISARFLEACPRLRVLLDERRGDAPLAVEVASAVRPTTGDLALRLGRLRSPEHYRLEIGADRIVLTGGGEPGLYYGCQTLIQIVTQAQHGRVPALRIDDGPDFAIRGFYHDISRGKVPTRATLLALIEKAAHYKLNQLQLYIEHTFAFARHADVWAGADPLTADDIRALDEHAARHHVELVPSLSTFGHFYTALVSPRKHRLNELPIDASQLPFSWWDRMAHYTLDCRQPESLELVREWILELRPLFRSRLFNICCDETFDLGRGRNASLAARLGPGRLYLDFLVQLMRIVRQAGCTPMFWGDIVGNHPELAARVPRDAIALDWDYSADLHETKARLFRRAGLRFLVCPGVCGWDRWINDLDTATRNIIGLVRHGRRTGAAGVLNTDWGDRGHINCLGNSFHGLVLGAAAAWNGRELGVTGFDAAFGRLELGDTSGEAVRLMRRAGRLDRASWRLFSLWLDPTPHRPADWWDEATGVPVDLLKIDPAEALRTAAELDRIGKKFARRVRADRTADSRARDELLLGCRGLALMNRLAAWIVRLAARRPTPREMAAILELTNRLREFEADFSVLWHARNRPSEYWRLRTALLEIARRVDLAALRGVWLRTKRRTPPPAIDVTSDEKGPGIDQRRRRRRGQA